MILGSFTNYKAFSGKFVIFDYGLKLTLFYNISRGYTPLVNKLIMSRTVRNTLKTLL